MATFPKLKTSAVAQYPATKTLRFRNQAVRFLDGREQRYRDSAGPLREWVIRLRDLDESEMAAIQRFFAENEGRLASFSFTDPWDGSEHSDCRLAGDEISFTSLAEMRGVTLLKLMENRS